MEHVSVSVTVRVVSKGHDDIREQSHTLRMEGVNQRYELRRGPEIRVWCKVVCCRVAPSILGLGVGGGEQFKRVYAQLFQDGG